MGDSALLLVSRGDKELTVMRSEAEYGNLEDDAGDREAQGGQIVERPSVHLRELRRNEGRNECAEPW